MGNKATWPAIAGAAILMATALLGARAYTACPTSKAELFAALRANSDDTAALNGAFAVDPESGTTTGTELSGRKDSWCVIASESALYVATWRTREILRIDFASGAVEVLATGEFVPHRDAMQVDELNGWLYWMPLASNQVTRCRISKCAATREVVATEESGSAFAFHIAQPARDRIVVAATVEVEGEPFPVVVCRELDLATRTWSDAVSAEFSNGACMGVARDALGSLYTSNTLSIYKNGASFIATPEGLPESGDTGPGPFGPASGLAYYPVDRRLYWACRYYEALDGNWLHGGICRSDADADGPVPANTLAASFFPYDVLDISVRPLLDTDLCEHVADPADKCNAHGTACTCSAGWTGTYCNIPDITCSAFSGNAAECVAAETKEGGCCYDADAGSCKPKLECTPVCAALTPDPAVVQWVPKIPKAEIAFSEGKLRVTVRAPSNVQGRSAPVITVGTPGSACSFPAGALWTSAADAAACEDVYTSAIPWSELKACGMSLTAEPESFVYAGQVAVAVTEPIGDNRGVPVTRTVSASRDVVVRLQRTLSLAATVSVSAPVVVVFGISEQAFNDAGVPGSTVELAVTVQRPYRLVGPTVSSKPPGFAVSIAPAAAQEGDGDLLKRWRLTIDTAGGCQLDGDYAILFTVQCDESVAAGDCPIAEGSGDAATVSIHLVSDDLCKMLEEGEIAAALDGQMAAYQDAAAAVPKAAFFASPPQTVYLKASVSSHEGVAIQEVAVTALRVEGAAVAGNVPVAVFDEAVSVSRNNYRVVSSTAGEVVVAFDTDDALFSVDPDATEGATIRATFSVTYSDLGRRKRSAAASAGADPVALRGTARASVAVAISNSMKDNETSPASSLTCPLAASVLTAFFATASI